MWKPLLVSLIPKMVLWENRILFKEHCPSSHQSALLSPSSALVLLTSTPRLEADEKGILFSQGQRDDLAQSSSDWGSGLIRTFLTDTSNHTRFLKPEQSSEGVLKLEKTPTGLLLPPCVCGISLGPVSKLPLRTLRKSPELVLCRGVWPPRVHVRLGT